jgi:hypothetical protein
MNVLTTAPRRAALIVASLAASLALGAGTASVASAGVPQQIRTDRGSAVFDDLGELVVATDDKADYLGVMATLTWSDGSVTAYASGAGKDQTKNVSIPEGETVWLIMCYYDRSGPVRCSDSQKGTA